MERKFFIFVAFSILSASGFTGSDDKFIKKYAMMKIYESCFGQDVVQQIRDEMRIAVAKCAALELEAEEATRRPSTEQTTVKTTTQTSNVAAPTFPNAIPISAQPLQDIKGGILLHESHERPTAPEDNLVKNTFDPDSLHQAILSYRPNPFVPSFRPYQPAVSSYFPGYANQPYVPQGPIGFYQHSLYSPSYPAFPPFLQPNVYGLRQSKDLDLSNHVEELKARLSGKVRNVTCVMQELGYLNDNLEPTYDKIVDKINSLPIHDELKKDIAEGIDFCKQFSMCIPESANDKSPFSSALMKPMFFFRCYKHKKLEACIMKDVRDRFTSLSEDNFDAVPEPDLLRKSKNIPINSKEKETSKEELETTIFDLLYGTDDLKIDDAL